MGGQCSPHNWGILDKGKQVLKCGWCGRETFLHELSKQELQRIVLATLKEAS